MTFGLSFAVNTGASHEGEGQCTGSAQGHGAQTELGQRVTVASVWLEMMKMCKAGLNHELPAVLRILHFPLT